MSKSSKTITAVLIGLLSFLLILVVIVYTCSDSKNTKKHKHHKKKKKGNKPVECVFPASCCAGKVSSDNLYCASKKFNPCRLDDRCTWNESEECPTNKLIDKIKDANKNCCIPVIGDNERLVERCGQLDIEGCKSDPLCRYRKVCEKIKDIIGGGPGDEPIETPEMVSGVYTLVETLIPNDAEELTVGENNKMVAYVDGKDLTLEWGLDLAAGSEVLQTSGEVANPYALESDYGIVDLVGLDDPSAILGPDGDFESMEYKDDGKIYITADVNLSAFDCSQFNGFGSDFNESGCEDSGYCKVNTGSLGLKTCVSKESFRRRAAFQKVIFVLERDPSLTLPPSTLTPGTYVSDFSSPKASLATPVGDRPVYLADTTAQVTIEVLDESTMNIKLKGGNICADAGIPFGIQCNSTPIPDVEINDKEYSISGKNINVTDLADQFSNLKKDGDSILIDINGDSIATVPCVLQAAGASSMRMKGGGF